MIHNVSDKKQPLPIQQFDLTRSRMNHAERYRRVLIYKVLDNLERPYFKVESNVFSTRTSISLLEIKLCIQLHTQ